jgi:nucleoside 2-deoxyribosyltransferase
MKKIYLAGPEVFLPNAHACFERHKQLCRQHGFEPLSPLDNAGGSSGKSGVPLARSIFAGNVEMIDQCDIVAANCNPFRGACVDDGTAWEIAYAFARGKQIYGYCARIAPLPKIVTSYIPTHPHESGHAIDSDGYLVNEDFGNTINLMLEFSMESSGGKLIEGDFETCLAAIKRPRQ